MQSNNNQGGARAETMAEAVARIQKQKRPGRQTRVTVARLQLDAITTKAGSNGGKTTN